MTKEQAIVYLRFSGFSDEQIKAIEGAFSCENTISALNRVMEYTYGMLTAEKAGLQHLIKSMLDDLPSVNQQEPCDKCVYSTSEGCQYDDITETIPPFETSDDAISRQELLNGLASIAKAKARSDAQKALMGRVMFFTEKLPPVNPQKPICPSAGVDCEDCPACEDTISRKVVLDILVKYDNDMGFDVYSEIFDNIDKLPSVSSSQKPKSECEHDHEILKAYSDGASAVLDKVRAEIDGLLNDEDNSMYAHGVMDCLEIIDKFMAEGSEKE